MADRATVIGTAKDLFGCWWDVREARATPHGFDALLGWPQAEDGGPKRGRGHGGPRLIPTRPLYRYWHRRRMLRDGSIYNLPIGKSTAKRLRGELRLNDYEDYRRWWQIREHDLTHLTLEEFAARHGVYPSQISVARKAMRNSLPR